MTGVSNSQLYNSYGSVLGAVVPVAGARARALGALAAVALRHRGALLIITLFHFIPMWSPPLFSLHLEIYRSG